jgi:hypothetical protein
VIHVEVVRDDVVVLVAQARCGARVAREKVARDRSTRPRRSQRRRASPNRGRACSR